MKRSMHRSAAALGLGTAVLLGTPVSALAGSTDYPAPSPSATVTGVDASVAPAADVTVADSGSALPRTGTDVAISLIAGAGLVGGGALLVASSRRKGARA
jgi:LPXTG-motif cell wall-anchored protein